MRVLGLLALTFALNHLSAGAATNPPLRQLRAAPAGDLFASLVGTFPGSKILRQREKADTISLDILTCETSKGFASCWARTTEGDSLFSGSDKASQEAAFNLLQALRAFGASGYILNDREGIPIAELRQVSNLGCVASPGQALTGKCSIGKL